MSQQDDEDKRTTRRVVDLTAVDRIDYDRLYKDLEEIASDEENAGLIARIKDLDDVEPPPGWEDRAMARWRSVRRARWIRIVLGIVTIMITAAVIAILNWK